MTRFPLICFINTLLSFMFRSWLCLYAPVYMCALGEELNQCLARGLKGKLQAGPVCVLAVCQGCRAGERRGRRTDERGGRVWNRAVASLTVLLSDGQSWFVFGAQLHSLESETVTTGWLTNRGCQRGDTA